MNIEVLHFFLLILSATYAVIGIQVQLLNRESHTNRLFLLTCISLSLWSLGYAFMISGTTVEHANTWRIVAALGWNTFYVHWISFIMRLTRARRFKIGSLMGFLYVPTVYFFLSAALTPPNITLRKMAMGWMDTSYLGLSEYLFTGFYITIMLYSLWLLHQWQKKAPFIRERKQAAIIKNSAIIALSLGAITDSLMPMMGIAIFPMGIIFIAGCMLAIWYAIAKYKLMTLSAYYLSEHILKAVGLPIIVLDDHNCLNYCNEAACQLFGVQHEQLIGKDIHLWLQDTTPDTSGIEGDWSRCGDELVLKNSQGAWIKCMMTLTILRDEFDDVLGKALILNDITNIKEAEAIISDYNKYLMRAVDQRTEALAQFNERLKLEAEERKHIEEQIGNLLYYDELTHLPNRLYFKNGVDQVIEHYQNAVENEKVFAVLFLDLDDFKYVNDSMGHYVGDELLKRVAIRLKELLWGHYLVSRNGGDEFLILIHDLPKEQAVATVEGLTSEIIKGFSRPFHVAGKDLFVTTSMGTSFFPKDGHDFDHLVRHADMSLFQAKQSGKNRAILSSGEMMSKINRMANLRNSLYMALDHRELMLYYQPQVDAQTERIIGMEALLRWRRADGVFVSPSEFIPLAEETGLIVSIGEWVIGEAARKIAELHQRGYTYLTMAINVSVNQIKEANFVQRVAQLLEENGAKPHQIEFEITERVGLQEGFEADQVIREIRALGISISIDDFGTEYSSFMTVKRLKIDKIKIAMEFVQNANSSKKDEAIVRTITSLGSILDMHVIAEGVENLEELEFVRKIHCHSVQGYYFYRPMSSAQLDEALLQDARTNSGESEVEDVSV